MTENIELIAASDLPTTNAGEVDVLCVENGELKRKPGASLGGDGYVIVLPSTVEISNDSIMVEENYDNFMNILYNGGSVWIDVSSVEALGGMSTTTPSRFSVIMWAYQDGAIILVALIQLNLVMFTFQNGTWTPPTT